MVKKLNRQNHEIVFPRLFQRKIYFCKVNTNGDNNMLKGFIPSNLLKLIALIITSSDLL